MISDYVHRAHVRVNPAIGQCSIKTATKWLPKTRWTPIPPALHAHTHLLPNRQWRHRRTQQPRPTSTYSCLSTTQTPKSTRHSRNCWQWDSRMTVAGWRVCLCRKTATLTKCWMLYDRAKAGERRFTTKQKQVKDALRPSKSRWKTIATAASL